MQFREVLQAENVETTACGDDQYLPLDLKEDYRFVELQSRQDLTRVLTHDGDLLGTEVLGGRREVAAHNKHNLLVRLHELDLAVVDFAHVFQAWCDLGVCRRW